MPKLLEISVLDDNPSVIEIKGLHKAYGALEVLKGVDVTAKRGDVVALIGSSGSGKSTLLRCCNMLETSQRGTIHFQGEAVKWKGKGHGRRPSDPAQVTRLRTNLSMVFQQFNLWAHMTILQNVMEAPVTVLKQDKSTVEARARALLQKVGIAEKCDVYPAQLSGGQQQRVAVARALASRPKFVLADEPTANLDSGSTEALLDIMAKLNKEEKITFIFSTHDQRVIDRAKRIIKLVDGEIVSDEQP